LIDRYLSLSYDELRSKKLLRMSSDLINEFYRELHIAIPEVKKKEGLAREYFFKYLKKITDDAEMLTRLRLSKAALGAELNEESIDYGVLKGIVKITILLRDYLSGRLLVTPDLHLVVKAQEELMYKGRLWRKGDIGSMDLVAAAFYYALDMIRPIQSSLSL